MNKLLWKPSLEKKENSLLKNFVKFVGLEVSSFQDIWKWSVENPEIFWSKFWDFSNIIGDKGKEIIKANDIFYKTKFFPSSRINYAENILKKRSNQIAIEFLSENGYEENISWKDLYEKVCRFS